MSDSASGERPVLGFSWPFGAKKAFSLESVQVPMVWCLGWDLLGQTGLTTCIWSRMHLLEQAGAVPLGAEHLPGLDLGILK